MARSRTPGHLCAPLSRSAYRDILTQRLVESQRMNGKELARPVCLTGEDGRDVRGFGRGCHLDFTSRIRFQDHPGRNTAARLNSPLATVQ